MTKTKKLTKMSASVCSVFKTKLGWMALEIRGNAICKLSFGHKTAKAAKEAARAQIIHEIDAGVSSRTATAAAADDAWIEKLAERLRDYASGRHVDFNDFEIDIPAMTDFGRRVIRVCRKIPYGKSLTYGELAARAGSSGAARAVGNHMAGNPIPLIVPCHRVLPAGKGRGDKDLGGYSAAGGVEMKRRLLEMEDFWRPAEKVKKQNENWTFAKLRVKGT